MTDPADIIHEYTSDVGRCPPIMLSLINDYLWIGNQRECLGYVWQIDTLEALHERLGEIVQQRRAAERAAASAGELVMADELKSGE